MTDASSTAPPPEPRLASDPARLGDRYATVVVGSGYGGAITAARLAMRGEAVCVLERGKEWPLGSFPETGGALAGNLRSKRHPFGLFDYYVCRDIDVLKGSGLGGTSLVNASVAIRPDADVFDDPRWPSALRTAASSGALWDDYGRAEQVLRVGHHPRFDGLTKVARMRARAAAAEGAEIAPVNLAVNFDVDGVNASGAQQHPCIDCGNCITGCNRGAKNTLDRNYLPLAKRHGAEIFTRVEVRSVMVDPAGDGYRLTVVVRDIDGARATRTIGARRVILSAGALGSTEILLRSAAAGLPVSSRLGHGFSGNGDYLGLAYNGEMRTDVLGFGNQPDSPRSAVAPGPTIVSVVRYDRHGPIGQRLAIEDFTTFPSGLVDLFRRTLPALALTGVDTDHGVRDKLGELQRIGRDYLRWDPDGAANHSMVYLVMAFDDGGGTIGLDRDGKVEITWPSVRTDPVFAHIDRELEAHARSFGATYVHLDRWNPWRGGGNLITAHPLGGCNLADDADGGVVDDRAQVYDGTGGVHAHLHVIDGAMVPMPIGVNPFLTISALAEHVAHRLPTLD
ncbi:MAG: FAD-dependent oxidoreductase [Acidobacteriota bacterium]